MVSGRCLAFRTNGQPMWMEAQKKTKPRVRSMAGPFPQSFDFNSADFCRRYSRSEQVSVMASMASGCSPEIC